MCNSEVNTVKQDEDIGVNTPYKTKQMCSSGSNTIIEPEVGISCKMSDNVTKIDTECNTHQFAEHVGVNTLSQAKTNQESSTLPINI